MFILSAFSLSDRKMHPQSFHQFSVNQCVCLVLMFSTFLSLRPIGHKHRHKRHRPRRPGAGVTGAPGLSPPVLGSAILSDLERLSSGLPGGALTRAESPAGRVASRASNDSSGDSGPHRRSKRFLSYPRFVEVMLVADSKMVEHHGSNLQHYILTLMSIVSPACRP